jgi:regulator of nucleoside diphosphate kinase
MKEPFICLCPEVTRENALAIIRWLEDVEVRKYLSDTQDVSFQIRQVIDRVGLPILTHLFSAGGRFYIIHDKKSRPVGFVRLVIKNAETEIVIVIGERNDWGRRMGTSAILESMKIAFFELRSAKMTARIHPENKRSIRAFLRAGFRVASEMPGIKRLEITMQEYLNFIRQGGSALTAQVVITELDQARLTKLVQDETHHGAVPESSLKELEGELARAKIVNSFKVPPEVITMNSRVSLRLGEEEMEVSLVYPPEADWSSNRLSILSPIGTAILGYREGDSIRWKVPSGVTEIQIRKVIYQPEAAGDYHL